MTSPHQGAAEDLAQSEVRKPVPGWSRALAHPIMLPDGRSLATLADIRTYLSRRLQAHPRPSAAWQRVTGLLLSAARSDEVDVADVAIALETALSAEATRPAEPSLPAPAARVTRAPKADPAQRALPAVDWTANAPKPPQLIRASFLSRVLGLATKDRKPGETS